MEPRVRGHRARRRPCGRGVVRVHVLGLRDARLARRRGADGDGDGARGHQCHALGGHPPVPLGHRGRRPPPRREPRAARGRGHARRRRGTLPAVVPRTRRARQAPAIRRLAEDRVRRQPAQVVGRPPHARRAAARRRRRGAGVHGAARKRGGRRAVVHAAASRFGVGRRGRRPRVPDEHGAAGAGHARRGPGRVRGLRARHGLQPVGQGAGDARDRGVARRVGRHEPDAPPHPRARDQLPRPHHPALGRRHRPPRRRRHPRRRHGALRLAHARGGAPRSGRRRCRRTAAAVVHPRRRAAHPRRDAARQARRAGGHGLLGRHAAAGRRLRLPRPARVG
mmetsp:Transcript_7271/g.25993  ORF Transcript_7271/g.25993 Transcript_7271/m.25993 type:complete len:337 (+) Transcript_7271:520-1530(+)